MTNRKIGYGYIYIFWLNLFKFAKGGSLHVQIKKKGKMKQIEPEEAIELLEEKDRIFAVIPNSLEAYFKNPRVFVAP